MFVTYYKSNSIQAIISRIHAVVSQTSFCPLGLIAMQSQNGFTRHCTIVQTVDWVTSVWIPSSGAFMSLLKGAFSNS